MTIAIGRKRTLGIVAFVASMAVLFGFVNPIRAGASGSGASRSCGARLDATLDRLREQLGDPGVQAVLVRRGRIVWSAERGTAVDPSTAVDAHTLFAYGSLGKTLLAAYALHLVESGALALDAPVGRYLGRALPGDDTVTVRMLLTHTSGYPDVYSSPEVSPLFGDQYDPDRAWTFATLAPGIHDPVEPGARWAYSNTGFIVLARVLGAVTPEPLPRALRHFAGRAGIDGREITMKRSAYSLQHLAHGYAGTAPDLVDNFAGATGIPTDLYGLPWGDGAFAGTARGVGRFLDALFVEHRLLRARSVRRMIQATPQSLAAGPSGLMQSYAMGAASYDAAGRTWHGHDGTYTGFTSMAATDVDRGVTIAVVTNREPRTTQPAIELWRALAETSTAGCGDRPSR